MMKNPSFKVYLMELVIVVVGITIAFQVNVYYEANTNKGLEINAIRNLQKELTINLEEFESLKDYRTNITQSTRSLMGLLNKGSFSEDEFSPLFFTILRTSTPDLQSNASAFYVNSNYGDEHLELKSELLVLDTYLQELMDMSEGYSERKDLFYFNEQMFESVDFSERVILDMTYFRTATFKNGAWMVGGDDMELNRLYEQAESQLNKVYSMTQEIIDGK